MTVLARLSIALAAAAVLVSPAQADPAAGLYSDVCLSPDTGDQGGVELRLVYNAGAPMVIFKTCEGGCWAQPTRAAALTGNTLSFIAANQAFDDKGVLADSQDHHFEVRFSGETATLTSRDYPGHQTHRLRHQKLSGPSNADLKDWPAITRRC